MPASENDIAAALDQSSPATIKPYTLEVSRDRQGIEKNGAQGRNQNFFYLGPVLN